MMNLGLGLGLGGALKKAPLPGASAQTLLMSMDGYLPVGSVFTRAGNAWNPETGLIAPHNVFLNSAIGVTQSITLSAVPQVLSFKGTGTITLSGAATGSLVGTGAADRVSLSFTPTAGSVTFTVSGSCSEVQVNQYSLTTYVPTGASAVYAPRYVTGKQGQAILIEKASTNLALQSADFSSSRWAKTGIKAFGSGSLADVIANPFGDVVADLITEDGTNTSHSVQSNPPVTVSSNTAYTLSVFAKAGTRTWLRLDPVNPAVSNNPTWFNLGNGTVGTNTAGNTATITSYGNGWYRCTVTRTTTDIQTTLIAQIATATADNSGLIFVGDNASGLYIWGAQLEALPYATSYIPSASTPVTRAADLLSYPTTNVLNIAQGTIACWVYIDPIKQSDSTVQTFFDHGNSGTGANRILLYKAASNLYRAYLMNATSTAHSYHEAVVSLTKGFHHFAMTYNASELALWIDGVKQTDPIASPTLGITIESTFRIGFGISGTVYSNTAQDNLRIFNRPLTDAEMLKLVQLGR